MKTPNPLYQFLQGVAMSISHEELKRLLHYDPETGVWTWLVSGHARVGKRADHLAPDTGYFRIRIKNKKYFSSRLAWFYMTREWPTLLVEHHDRDRSNNKWINLRLAEHWQNSHNTKPRSNKYKGVFFIKKLGRYRAQICVRGIKHSLGYADSEEDAALLYKIAAEKLVGEFACVE